MAYTITVKQGDLLNEEADFIVNASNTRLILGSGVSMSFRRHCGTTLQTEMEQSLQGIKALLQKGDVVVTSSGDSKNFTYALHAAILDYNRGIKRKQKNPTLETIQTSLENIEKYLEWYNKDKQQTIKLVLPLMGCGAGGLDKIDVIKIYKTFFQKQVSYKCDAIIYGYSLDDYLLIKSIIFS